MKKIYIAILVIFAVFLAIGCSGSGSNSDNNYQQGNTTDVTQAEEKQPLEIIDSKLVKEQYGGYSITGTAKANKDLGYAEVSAKCYGTDGAVMGSYIANMNNLAAGETWNFKVIGPFEGVVTNYTIRNGNSF